MRFHSGLSLRFLFSFLFVSEALKAYGDLDRVAGLAELEEAFV
jgi:hypothetical protein